MSISLAIDTSTLRTSVAVLDGVRVLWSGHHDGATSHGQAISELAAQALERSSHIDRVVVGMGPGPYTGLRVGIAFAHTFALARGCEIIGVCSLDAILSPQDSYIVATDARRKEIYWARYKDGVRVEGPSVSKPADVGQYIYDVYPDMAKLVALSERQNITEPLYLRRPDAVPTAQRPQ